jgi:predicted RecA/RadA family phage recombinase
MKNYVQDGDMLDLVAPSGGVVSGTAYLIGAILIVAAVSAAEGEAFAGATEGVYTLPKTTGEAWTQGAKLYWNDTTKKLTTTASGNTLVGVATAAAASADTSGNCRLGIVA